MNFSIKQDFNQSNNFLTNGVGSDKTSKRYQPIATSNIIETLTDNGYHVNKIVAPQYRKEENALFNTHLVRLTDLDSLNELKTLKKEVPEILIKNNLNGQASLEIMLGIYRMVCSNGMILGDQFFNYKVAHKGKDFTGRVLNGVIAAHERFNMVKKLISDLKAINLNADELFYYRKDLMSEVIKPMIIESNTKGKVIDVKILSNFNPKRKEDLAHDAWTVFNRYQEYVIRGGIKFEKTIEVKPELKTPSQEMFREVFKENLLAHDLQVKRGTTREVKSINKDKKLNTAIFDHAIKYFNIAA